MHEEPLWQAWCDGCARPNPGHIGLGALLLGPDGSRHELSQRSPHNGCNNEAEARALLATLELALSLGARKLQAFSDSDVLVRRINDPACTEAARLAGLFAEIQACLAQFPSAALHWIPHHRNQAADQLARAALGLPARQTVKARKRK